MSFRVEKLMKFSGSGKLTGDSFIGDIPDEEVRNLFLELLYSGINGLCFSLYDEGQKPGDPISEEQVRRKMDLLKSYTRWIRSFSCTEGNELIPKIAKEYGLKTLVGAWLGNDKEKNDLEIEGLIALARDGYVDIAAVGNEVLYRGDLIEDELLGYIDRVRSAIPGITVGYVDAYYEFVQRPRLADACDVILCNCYPFWEGSHFNDSLQHMKHMYREAVRSGKGKKVIITETGWPSEGGSLGNAIPSAQNAMKYFINTQLWAADENVETFYFSSFDESWKVSTEGDVGAFWGIWDKSGKLKYVS
ncbi:MAG: glycosyl hydrolase [Bacteroidales bacterium]|nr:glycosyl hydrolase [Bacteroidales bacterium]